MWSHTDLDGDMQTKTFVLQGILSLISHIAVGDDDPVMPAYPRDVASGNLSLQSVGKINNLIMPPPIFSTPLLFSPFVQY